MSDAHADTKPIAHPTLRQQAASNTKEQFANSPDLNTVLTSALIDALDAHTQMSTQALNSQTWNNLALSGNHLLLRNAEEAVCYELATVDP